MSSEILIKKKPIVINAPLAKLVGLNEAIVLQQMEYWINDINKQKGEDSVNYQDGYYWTFNSYEEWQEEFPFWSTSTIRRTITKLENRKLIISGNYNRLKIDRTKWYRILYKNLDELCYYASVQNEQFKWSDWIDHITKLTKPLPESTSKSTSKITEKHKGVNPERIENNSFSINTSIIFDEFIKNFNEEIKLDIIEAIRYFLNKYRYERQEHHPKLKFEQWRDVIYNLRLIKNPTHKKKYETNLEYLKHYEPMINKYFETKYQDNCDYRLNHFANEEILGYLYLSVGGTF